MATNYCIDDNFDKPFKLYLGEDVVYNFNKSIIEEMWWSEVMKMHFNKKLVMTKKDNDDFENSTKCWVCDNVYVDGDIKVAIPVENIKVLHIEINISMLIE